MAGDAERGGLEGGTGAGFFLARAIRTEYGAVLEWDGPRK